jgi:nicotinamidase-related amidase
VFIGAVDRGEQVQNRCAFAIAVAGRLSLPIMFTEQVPEKLGGTAASLLELAPTAAVYPKRSFSALADERIRTALLQETSTEHLLLCGIETSVCIYQTAIAALGHGLEVTILSDCVSARRTDDARVCLDALARAGAHILPSETVFYAVLNDVGHPFFKEYTQLVKRFGT